MAYVIDEETPYQDPHSRGTGSIVTQRKGYILRTRGEHNRLVRHDYECPVHGVFEVRVPSGAVPNDTPCGHCDRRAVYVVPTVAQGISAGSVKC